MAATPATGITTSDTMSATNVTKASMRSARRINGLRPKMRPIRQQRGSSVKVSITTPLSPNDSYVLRQGNRRSPQLQHPESLDPTRRGRESSLTSAFHYDLQ